MLNIHNKLLENQNMKRIYYVSVLVLSVISITLALLDISNVISINAYTYNYADKFSKRTYSTYLQLFRLTQYFTSLEHSESYV